MKIAVVFDTLHPDWEDVDYKKEVDAKVEEAEYDVARALLAQGHDVLLVGVADQLAPVLERLATFRRRDEARQCNGSVGRERVRIEHHVLRAVQRGAAEDDALALQPRVA